jgi:hypothetical protein
VVIGSPAVSGVTISSRSVSNRGSFFFCPWAPGPRHAHPIGAALGERRGQFPSSALNGVWIQPGHVRDQLVTPVPEAVGLDGGIPSPLLFIQAGQQQVHLVVPHLIRMRGVLLAMRTLAPVDFDIWHGTLQCIRSVEKKCILPLASEQW